ncbi:hypothetical protein [Sphingosinicella sp. BN140058]|uniref:hypothetical protein n=1 Tax=Sphingosinicella sp. BN140058 TaxID=1892855 RepID=UPI00101263DB|nr:hypothetical protein [Sphingosinicella sp. BN140058]QAY78024.1 hypothetical protein ETR14_16960 [Sphingosinicella sp. BN140058]
MSLPERLSARLLERAGRYRAQAEEQGEAGRRDLLRMMADAYRAEAERLDGAGELRSSRTVR